MRVAVVHGYYLHDSGSGIYVREVARELVQQGHDVTLVCQERSPELYDFIDAVYVFDKSNTEPIKVSDLRQPLYRGRCRLIRPHLSRLLVYVEGPFPGFPRERISRLQDSSSEWVEAYLSENLTALRAAFARWAPDVVLANHVVMQPWLVKRALDAATPYITTIHGSALNFTVRQDPRLVPFAAEGLSAAAAVVAVSKAGAEEVARWALEYATDIRAKTVYIPPGIDGRTFAPAPDRATAIEALAAEVPLVGNLDLSTEDQIIVYAGRVIWTKGVQHAVSALPLVIARHPKARLLVAGEGPARRWLEELARLLARGDEEAARVLVSAREELRTPPEFGPVVPGPAVPVGTLRVHFLGHLDTTQLGCLFAAADLSVAPSVFPEAAGLVTVEALSTGALPLASYHSGLTSVVDAVADALNDPRLRTLTAGKSLTIELADLISHVLEKYPTADRSFRQRLHEIGARHYPSWGAVTKQYIELVGDTMSSRRKVPDA